MQAVCQIGKCIYIFTYSSLSIHTPTHTHTQTHMRGYKVSSLNKGIMEEVAKRVMDGEGVSEAGGRGARARVTHKCEHQRKVNGPVCQLGPL